jgi:hypothetical protein
MHRGWTGSNRGDTSRSSKALRALGDVLGSRGYANELVVVGGAALLLRGTVSRPTKDGDVVGERRPDGSIARLDVLPPELARAALDVARAYGLADDREVTPGRGPAVGRRPELGRDQVLAPRDPQPQRSGRR